MRLLDADIMIDVSRRYPPAVQWLANVAEMPAIAGFALVELLEGCANKIEMSRVRNLVAPYPLLWPPPSYCHQAMELFAQFSLSHNLDLVDAFIAATALEHGATLCTFNVKHFAAVPGLLTEQPYPRT